MLKSFKVRLYPNKQQKEMLNKHFGCCRFVYNAGLNYKTYIYNNYKLNKSKVDIINELPSLKEEFVFLKEVKAEVLQNTITNLDYAFNNFYKSGKEFPKFKKKNFHNSFTQNQNFIINNDKLTFYSHKIKYKCSEKDKEIILNNKVKKITYSKNACEQYFASILVDIAIERKPKTNKEIGIDLGIANFLVTSDQEFISSPRFLNKSLKGIKIEQQKLFLKTKGSNNYKKQKQKLAKKYNKTSNQRSHFLHNLSSKLINENQVVYVEDLNITGMLINNKEDKKHSLNRNINDCSWFEFVRQLTYKAEWYGREIKKIDRFYPSSKTCSKCNHIKKDLTLEDRVFKCNNCGLEIDRDYNASLNILSIGRNYTEDIKKLLLKRKKQ